MTFDIRMFSAEIANAGVLRGNRFTYFSTVPPALQAAQQTVGGRLQDIASRLEYYGESGNIPGAALMTHEVHRYGYGPVEKKPFAVAFNDCALNFRVDAKGDIYDFFRAWIGLIIPFETGQSGMNTPIGVGVNQMAYEVSYKEDYAVDVTLTSYDDSGNWAIKTTLKDAYPILVGDLPHDWATKGDYVRLPVVLTYLDWYSSRPFAASTNGQQTAAPPATAPADPTTNADTGPVTV